MDTTYLLLLVKQIYVGRSLSLCLVKTVCARNPKPNRNRARIAQLTHKRIP